MLEICLLEIESSDARLETEILANIMLPPPLYCKVIDCYRQCKIIIYQGCSSQIDRSGRNRTNYTNCIMLGQVGPILTVLTVECWSGLNLNNRTLSYGLVYSVNRISDSPLSNWVYYPNTLG